MNKRQAILDTALALFVRQGVENTPTAQISRESGVATGTLFHHFSNKEELVRALVLEVKQSYFDAVNAALDGIEGFRPQVRAVWLASMRWALRHPAGFQFKSQLDSQVNLDAETQRQLDSMWQGLDELIAGGVARGFFKAMPQDLLFQLLETQVEAAARYFIDNPEAFERESLREMAFAALWDSVAA